MSATTPFEIGFAATPRTPSHPVASDAIPPWLSQRPPLRARFARSERDLEAIQRLRYRVFNLELGEGLPGAHRTGRDVDGYDASSHHLMVIDERAGIVVGTYRLATRAMTRGAGFYAEREFDLGALDPHLLASSVELGRACIAAPYRGRRVLAMLWQGIAAYAAHNGARFLFGCTSLPAAFAPAAGAITRSLAAAGSIDADLVVRPRPGFEPGPALDAAPFDLAALPPLLRRYLALGARVAAQPALDREFGTLDYFTALDVARLAQSGQRLLRTA
jgi:putative hemolysin